MRARNKLIKKQRLNDFEPLKLFKNILIIIYKIIIIFIVFVIGPILLLGFGCVVTHDNTAYIMMYGKPVRAFITYFLHGFAFLPNGVFNINRFYPSFLYQTSSYRLIAGHDVMFHGLNHTKKQYITFYKVINDEKRGIVAGLYGNKSNAGTGMKNVVAHVEKYEKEMDKYYIGLEGGGRVYIKYEKPLPPHIFNKLMFSSHYLAKYHEVKVVRYLDKYIAQIENRPTTFEGEKAHGQLYSMRKPKYFKFYH